MSRRQAEQRGFDNLDAIIRISRKDEQLKDPYVLHDLCLRQEIDLLIQLLESDEGHRRNIDGRNQNGLTPLHVAVVSPEPPYLEDLINYLLYYGADRDAKCTPDGNTSLHLAIIYSKLFNAEISVPLLLKEGAVPNLRNFAERTPKDYAYAKGYADLAALLEEIERHPERRHEIDIYNWKEKFGANRKNDGDLLETAIQQGNAEGVKQLAGRMSTDEQQAKLLQDMLCYHRAVLESRRNKAQVIDSLGSSGVDPRSVDDHGNTAIQLAISSLPHDQEMIDVIKALLKAGVPKEPKNKENKDALTMSIERDYKDVEELLRGSKRPEPARPPPPPQPQKRGRSVHEILADKSLTSKKKLAELEQLWTNYPSTNPNVRTTDNMADTPLHIVVRRDQEELVDFFLSKNAIVNVKNKRNETPIMLAQRTEFGFNLGVYEKLKEVNRTQIARKRWTQLGGRIGEQQTAQAKANGT
ncbi:hypothetical protein BOX15_Mlig030431g3 [Macrostomum lignano]|uniref:ANK_REP_REGION domain-containing protein n=2 Tax=Macrostomum lignano TaxID=282301 RepID=A0A1I8IML3_9PLAT|nr:hypothetical protein BOX15_Mlig030431g3 [Macrostomum lignano]